MANANLRLPFIENRTRVLQTSSLLSLFIHGLLLLGLGYVLPVKIISPPADMGISINLATVAQPAPELQAGEEKHDPSALQPTGPEPAPARESLPKPVPKRMEQPKKPVAAKPAHQKKTASTANSQGKSAIPGKGTASASQATSSAPIAKSTPPAPSGGANTPRPAYPELARKRGQEGTVRVICQVDASGHVTAVSVAKSSGFRLLDEAALKAVNKWKFKPGQKDGASIAGSVIVPVDFRLK